MGLVEAEVEITDASFQFSAVEKNNVIHTTGTEHTTGTGIQREPGVNDNGD